MKKPPKWVDGLHNRLGSEKGQVLAITVFALVLLLGVVALVVDVGQIMLAKRKLQAGVDLAALAGAQALTANPGQARLVALDYAEKNGLSRFTTAVTVDPILLTVQVGSHINVSLFFAWIFGYSTAGVSASATAQVGTASITAFDYVLFSGSQTADFRVPGSHSVIDGRTHVNANAVIPGSDNWFNQDFEIAGVLTANPKNFYTHVVQPAPVLPMPAYDMAQLKQQAVMVYDGNLSLANVAPNGIIFVNGNVNISGHHISGRGMIVATGSISISSSDFRYDSATDFMTFYALGNISLSGSDSHFDGIYYAPQGEIRIPGSSNTFFGSLVAQSFAIPGSYQHFIYDSRAQTAAISPTAHLIQ